MSQGHSLYQLQCLHCSKVKPLAPSNLPCSACLAQGLYVGHRLAYSDPKSPTKILQPYEHLNVLGEGNTPIITLETLAQSTGCKHLVFKDESANPTGSHKDRMSAIATRYAREQGMHTMVLASSGNAALSAAHYAKATGLQCEVAHYSHLGAAFQQALQGYGARLFGYASNQARWNHVAEKAALPGYLALTNYHLPALGSLPIAVEGYKNIAQESLAQLSNLTDVLVPTARGDLAWGIFAGFQELLQFNRIQALPRIWVVEPFPRLSKLLADHQASLSDLHQDFAGQTKQFSTAGATLTYLQWQAATQSQGGAVAVSDDQAHAARKQLLAWVKPPELCAAACLAGLQQLRAENRIPEGANVMMLLTASAQFDPTWP